MKDTLISPDGILVTVLVTDEIGQSASNRYGPFGRLADRTALGVDLDRLNALAMMVAEELDRAGMRIDPAHGFGAGPIIRDPGRSVLPDRLGR